MEASSQPGFRTRSHEVFFFSDKTDHHISSIIKINSYDSMESLNPNDIHYHYGCYGLSVVI